MKSAYMLTGPETADLLEVQSETGLNDRQVAASREKYGGNGFSGKKPVSLLKRILEAAGEPMMIMLMAAGVIALGVNITRAVTGGEADFLECVGIFAAIALSVIITVLMEGRSAKAFEALNKMNDDIQIRVIRSGKPCLIPQQEVVVGDIVCVETGDKLPADGRLLSCTDLNVDESALTGESEPVKKNADFLCANEKTPVAERKNMLYSGCFVTGGNGVMAVTDVGDSTEFGKIAQELSGTEKSSTPLQEKLAKLGKTITILGTGAAAVVFIVQVITFILNGTASFGTVSEAFISSIVLIVAAVPEGLPTIVAVSLSVNIIKMSKQNALVKKLIACETVGCIDVICSDKTGTLTKNRMTVTDVYTDGSITKPDQIGDRLLLNNFCVNSTADVRFGSEQSFIGNPTECALLVAARASGVDYTRLRSDAHVLHVFPFSSETKNMTTLVAENGTAAAYTKGSPEKILAMCTVNEREKSRIEEAVGGFQAKACRVIAFAHKEIPLYENYEDARGEIERAMVYDGFVAITDPLRDEVYDAVDRCRSAGIDLKMLTGDNIITAKAIAAQLGILDEEHIAVEAHELEELDDNKFAALLPKIRVIARSTPIIKMRVVNALKSGGHVVAVTGDGINDAPAIKNADVGIAMGISGTDVSKEASDIVLLDDSFATIVKAVQWGRGIYENFKRFIQFQLTVNLSSVIVVLASILGGFAAPFTALQLLWVNIIMDGPPALTLGLEPIRNNLMDRKPTRRDAGIVSKNMLLRIVTSGVYISIVFMLQHVFNFLGATEQQQPAVLFTLFVVFQLFNAFNCRELTDESIFRRLLSNKLMLLVFALTFSLQIVIIQFGGAFFGTVPLTLLLWVQIIALGLTVILFSEIIRLIKRAVAKRQAN